MRPKIYYNESCLTDYQQYQVKSWDQVNRKKIGLTSTELEDVYKSIRKECFLSYPNWQTPTKEEVIILFNKTGMTQKQACAYIGLKENNGRTFRRFTMGESPISYAYWVLLCEYIGIPKFW